MKRIRTTKVSENESGITLEVREVQASRIQIKLFKTIMDAVESDPELVEFCSTPAIGKSYILYLVDTQFDDWTYKRLNNPHPQ